MKPLKGTFKRTCQCLIGMYRTVISKTEILRRKAVYIDGNIGKQLCGSNTPSCNMHSRETVSIYYLYFGEIE
jgi:hypothetical protein